MKALCRGLAVWGLRSLSYFFLRLQCATYTLSKMLEDARVARRRSVQKAAECGIVKCSKISRIVFVAEWSLEFA